MKEINSQLDKLGVDKITLSISLFLVLFIATFISYDTQFAQKIIDQIENFGRSFRLMTIDTVKGFLADSKKSKFNL